MTELRDSPTVIQVDVPGTCGAPGMVCDMLRAAHPCEAPWVRLDKDMFWQCIAFIKGHGLEIESLQRKRSYGQLTSEAQGICMNGGGRVIKKVDGHAFGQKYITGRAPLAVFDKDTIPISADV